MTPSQKAWHLFEEYYKRFSFVDGTRRRHEAKTCALICLHEMYAVAVRSDNQTMVKYLQSVKREIELL